MRSMSSWDDVVRLGAALPETEVSTHYGTPALKVRRRMYARLRDDGETLVVRVDMGEREALMRAEPEVFHITDHYREYPYVLVALAAIPGTELREVLAESWLRAAPKRLAAQHEAELTAPTLVVYEKRTCTTCKKLAALLEERGIPFERVEYHVDGLAEPEIRELLALAGIGPRDALRTREPLVKELGLDDGGVSDRQLVRHMAEHPQLLQRPIVVRGDRAVLARPVERVLELFG
jgi:arsenate reductase (glutaredoxin)